MNELLLVIECFIAFVGAVYLLRRDPFIGLYFVFLFIYGIFAQLGYLYVPDLSAKVGAYFGPDVWLRSTFLIIFSLASFIALFAVAYRPLVTAFPLEFGVSRLPPDVAAIFRILAMGAILALTSYQLGYLYVNFGQISWESAQQAETSLSQDYRFALFILFYKISIIPILALYCRSAGTPLLSGRRVLFALLVALFIVVSVKLGNRSDPLALCLGILCHAYYRHRPRGYQMIKFLFAAFLLFVLIDRIESVRTEVRQKTDWVISVLFNDYFGPAHMLFGAMAYNIVDPAEVITSNVRNAGLLSDHPYLQATVTNAFAPGVATRSAGYAFYVLTEGYMFAGVLGPLYNAVVLVFYLSLWRRISMTSSPALSLFTVSLMSMMVVGLVRSQTSYFVKDIYEYIIPGMLMFAALDGSMLVLRWKRKAGQDALRIGTSP